MGSVFDIISGSSFRIGVVGESTARAVRESLGREPDLTASPATSANLAHQLLPFLGPDDRVLHVRGNKSASSGRGSFSEILTSHGCAVSRLVVYHNSRPELEPLDMPERGIVVLASPSAAQSFFYYNPVPPANLVYLAIGPTTAGYLKQMELSSVIEAPKPDTEGILKEIQHIIEGGFSDE